jgi:hypothetical protein
MVLKPCGVVYIVVASPIATKEIGFMGGEIEFHQGICSVVALKRFWLLPRTVYGSLIKKL